MLAQIMQTLYGAANMAQTNNLERRYQDLQEQQKRLTDILDRISQSQGR